MSTHIHKHFVRALDVRFFSLSFEQWGEKTLLFFQKYEKNQCVWVNLKTIFIVHLHNFIEINRHTNGSKMPFTPKVADYAKTISCVIQIYAMLIPLHTYFKDLPSILGCEPITSFKKLPSQNLPPLGVKGILLLLVEPPLYYTGYLYSPSFCYIHTVIHINL